MSPILTHKLLTYIATSEKLSLLARLIYLIWRRNYFKINYRHLKFSQKKGQPQSWFWIDVILKIQSRQKMWFNYVIVKISKKSRQKFKSSWPQVFCKKGVHRKLLCWSLFINKTCNFKKKRLSSSGVFLRI